MAVLGLAICGVCIAFELWIKAGPRSYESISDDARDYHRVSVPGTSQHRRFTSRSNLKGPPGSQARLRYRRSSFPLESLSLRRAIGQLAVYLRNST